jgi:hypothetical protein
MPLTAPDTLLDMELAALGASVVVIALVCLTASVLILGRNSRDAKLVADMQSRTDFIAAMQAMAAANERVTRDALATVERIVAPAPEGGKQSASMDDLAAMFSAYPEHEEEVEGDWTEDFVPADRQDVAMGSVHEPMPSTGRSVVDILGGKIGLDGPDSAG